MKLNLGSGPCKGVDGWTNLDQLDGADLCLDLSRGLPVNDDSVDLIYTSHFLEHLSYAEICATLRDCHRALKPGGTISLCVPDAAKYIEAYVHNHFDQCQLSNGAWLQIPTFLIRSGETIYGKALVSTGSRIDWLNYIAYSGGQHRYLFDAENLVAHLKSAGFVSAAIRPFCATLDLPMRQAESIYAEAFKPI